MIKKRITKEIYDSQKEDFHTSFATINNIRKKALEIGTSPEDAVSLYIAYAEQTTIQQSLKSWSNNSFMMSKMGWGKVRITNARKVLFNAGVIEEIQGRKQGRLGKKYIKINYLKRINVSETCAYDADAQEVMSHHLWGEQLGVGLETNADISKINADISKKENTEETKSKYVQKKFAPNKKNQNCNNSNIAILKKSNKFEEYRKAYPNKKGKARAKKLFNKKITNEEKFKELMKGLEGYKSYVENFTEYNLSYRMGDVFLSKETWIDYLEENEEESFNKFDEFRELYPKKEGYEESKKIYNSIIKNEEKHNELIKATKLFCIDISDIKYAKSPSNYLKEKRWKDYIIQGKDEYSMLFNKAIETLDFSMHSQYMIETYGEDWRQNNELIEKHLHFRETFMNRVNELDGNTADPSSRKDLAKRNKF